MLSEGIKKDPAKAAEVEGEPDLSLAKLAALNRAKCSRVPSSYPTRLQQALINEKTATTVATPEDYFVGPDRRSDPTKLQAGQSAEHSNESRKRRNQQNPEEYPIGPN